MRDRQPTKNNYYHLPKTLYNRVLYTIRDYDRLKQSKSEINLNSGNVPYEKVDSNHIGNPTEDKAITLCKIDEDIKAIDFALKRIPEEYATPIFDNIRYGPSCLNWVQNKDYASKNTWSMYRVRFIYNVAKNLNLL